MPTSLKLKNVVPIRRGTKTYWYFRRRGFPLVPMPGKPGDPDFVKKWAELQEQLRPSSSSRPSRDGTLSHLIETYKAAPAFLDLKPATQAGYRAVLDHLEENFGKAQIKDITRGFVVRIRDANAGRRRFANYIVQVMRILLNFAVQREMLAFNPLGKIELLRLGGGHKPWPVDALRSATTTFSAPMDLALLLGVHTGQRRENIVRLRWEDYDGMRLSFPSQKGGDPVLIPASAELKLILDARRPKSGEGPVLGQDFTLRHFSKTFRAACRAAGVPDDLTFHGLRYTAAGRYADAGATDEEIMAVTGHRTVSMVKQYTAKSRGGQRAANAVAKLQSANTISQCAKQGEGATAN